MKRIFSILIVCQFIFLVSANAQFKGNLYFSGHYVIPTQDYLKSLTESIYCGCQEGIQNSGLGYGADAYIGIRQIVAGAGFQYYSLKRDKSVNSQEVGLNSLGMHAKVGWDFSKSLDLQVIPALRLGVANSELIVPKVEGFTTEFGDVVVGEDNIFASSVYTYGLEIGVIRLFGNNSFNFGLGISAYIDWSLGSPEWNLNDTVVNEVVSETYSIFGVSVKLGGVYSNY